MADLNFGETDREALAVAKDFLQRVNQDLYNHGRDGLITRFNGFIASYEAREKEQEKQHKSNVTRLNLIIAILALIASYIVMIATIKGLGKAKVDDLFHSTIPADYTAER